MAEKFFRVRLRDAGIRVMEAAHDRGSPHAAVRRLPSGVPVLAVYSVRGSVWHSHG